MQDDAVTRRHGDAEKNVFVIEKRVAMASPFCVVGTRTTQKGGAESTIMRNRMNIFTPSTAVPWLVVCLLGFVAGLWPDAIVHPKTPRAMAPLPALSALTAAQVIFLLLVFPLLTLRRAAKPRIPDPESRIPPSGFCPGLATVELVTLLIVATPFAVAAAWFADGGVADVFRSALCVSAFIPLSVALCAWTLPARSPAARAAAMTLALLTTAGLPAGVYISHEFLRPAWADALWSVAPTTLAWTNANAAANATLLPTPLSPLTFWLLAGAAGLIGAWMTTGKASRPVNELTS